MRGRKKSPARHCHPHSFLMHHTRVFPRYDLCPLRPRSYIYVYIIHIAAIMLGVHFSSYSRSLRNRTRQGTCAAADGGDAASCQRHHRPQGVGSRVATGPMNGCTFPVLIYQAPVAQSFGFSIVSANGSIGVALVQELHTLSKAAAALACSCAGVWSLMGCWTNTRSVFAAPSC